MAGATLRALYHNKLYFGLSNGIYQVPVTDMGDLSYVKNNFKSSRRGPNLEHRRSAGGHLLAGRDDGLFEVGTAKYRQYITPQGFGSFSN
jgi:hypothetical protein